MTGPNNPPKEEASNRFSLLTPSEEDDGGPPEFVDSDDESAGRATHGDLTGSVSVVSPGKREETKGTRRARRWSRNASQRKTRGGRHSISILRDIRGDTISGCSENAEEWEELEFLVDSGASATVVGKDDVRAVAASEPDPSRHYKMADGIIIPIWEIRRLEPWLTSWAHLGNIR